MKTGEELNALKNEAEALNKKLAELTKEELEPVSGGSVGAGRPADISIVCPICGGKMTASYDWETHTYTNIYCCTHYDFSYGGLISADEYHRMETGGWDLEKYPNQMWE